MNKKLISAAVLLGLSSAATAVNVNQDGMGSVLLFPYYTTNNNKSTNIEIVNTTGETKAVKVRFNEGVNTWEVLDFNLYLSPYDVWTAVVHSDGTSVKVTTSDTSCTAPLLTTQNFNPALIDLYSDEHKDPGTLTKLERMAEGHFEVIEMGEINNVTLEAAIKHGSNGVPADCDAVRGAWDSRWTRSNPGNGVDVTAPTGGLFGAATIVDVINGSAAGYDATAIEGFYEQPVHAYPGSSFPNVAGLGQQGGSGDLVADIANKTAKVVYNNEVISATFGNSSDALSAVLMADSVSNTFFSKDMAATDWVLTFPTKHAYVNKNTADNSGTGAFFAGQYGKLAAGETGATTGKVPFSKGFEVPLSITLFDREERKKTSGLQFSPAVNNKQAIYYEVNVLEFDRNDDNVFGSKLANKVNDTPFDDGWANVNFANEKLSGESPAGAPVVFNGRPVIGFAMAELRGTASSTGGTLANYGAIYHHKYKRSITSQ